MKLVFSDIAENSDEGDPSEINSDVNTIGVDDLIKDIKQMIESDDDHKDKLASYLSDIEKKMESNMISIFIKYYSQTYENLFLNYFF